MSGHRQAAVALYGLARSDQEGILTELGESDQRILRGYLDELAELGFDKAANNAMALDGAPDVMQAANAAASMPTVAAAHAHLPCAARVAGTIDYRACLRAADAADVFAAVAEEPPALVAQMLLLEAWPWAGALLGMFPFSDSRKIQILIRAGVVAAPARQQFLVAALSERLGVRRSLPDGDGQHRLFPFALAKWLPWTR